MEKKIVIAGGTGFIGRYISDKFREDGYNVIIISRNPKHVQWTDKTALIQALNDAEVLINLAGKSVNCRYNAKNRALILHSRVDTTKRLQEITDECAAPPKLWINSSSATIYRHAMDRPMDEATGVIGTGFSVDVAKAWEKSFFEIHNSHTRKVALRITIVLGKDGGVIKPYNHLVRFGLGGKQGNGKQMFSWIHIEDLYRAINFIIAKKQMKGIYNGAAPNPVSNKNFMAALRKILKPVIFIPSPAYLLKFGAWLIGTETELILKSRWVLPKRMQEGGFQFKYPTIEEALEEIFKQ